MEEQEIKQALEGLRIVCWNILDHINHPGRVIETNLLKHQLEDLTEIINRMHLHTLPDPTDVDRDRWQAELEEALEDLKLYLQDPKTSVYDHANALWPTLSWATSLTRNLSDYFWVVMGRKFS